MDTVKLPRKRFFRQRAHSNVFSDHDLEYPIHPSLMDWSTYYPGFFPSLDKPMDVDGSGFLPPPPLDQLNKQTTDGPRVEFADIGCGYGGLSIALAELYPDRLVLGMEIRVKVTEYVRRKIEALRLKEPGRYNNVAVIRMNAMKFLPNFFYKGQVSQIQHHCMCVLTRLVDENVFPLSRSTF
jgi:tRNA (guanine-N7-)-methyltransferase